MTIREIIDAVDREISAALGAVKRLKATRERILTACRDRDAAESAGEGDEGGEAVCLKMPEPAKPAAKRRAA